MFHSSVNSAANFANTKFPSIAGVVLLEWMIATSLGIFLIIALGRLYQTIATDYAFGEARFRVATTIAVTEQMMSDRLHLSTALPCGDTPGQINLVTGGETTYWLDLFHRARQTHAYDSLEAAAIRRRGAAVGERADGSDVLVVFTTQHPIHVIAHDVVAGTFTLAEATTLQPGAFALVCDPQVSALFQVTQLLNGQQQLSYRGQGVAPGNCASDFDTNNPCAPNEAYTFTDNTLLTAVEPIVLFVGHSHNTARRSLYHERLSLIHSNSGTIRATMRREEILEGVEIFRARLLGDGVLDIGIVAAAPLPVANFARAPTYLLGEDVTSWLHNTGELYGVTEFSLAL